MDAKAAGAVANPRQRDRQRRDGGGLLHVMGCLRKGTSGEAWCELGYVAAEDNQCLFSANDVAAGDEAVRRHAGDLEQDDDLDNDEAANKNLPALP